MQIGSPYHLFMMESDKQGMKEMREKRLTEVALDLVRRKRNDVDIEDECTKMLILSQHGISMNKLTKKEWKFIQEQMQLFDN